MKKTLINRLTYTGIFLIILLGIIKIGQSPDGDVWGIIEATENKTIATHMEVAASLDAMIKIEKGRKEIIAVLMVAKNP